MKKMWNWEIVKRKYKQIHEHVFIQILISTKQIVISPIEI